MQLEQGDIAFKDRFQLIKNGNSKEFTNKFWPEKFYIPGNLLND